MDKAKADNTQRQRHGTPQTLPRQDTECRHLGRYIVPQVHFGEGHGTSMIRSHTCVRICRGSSE